MLSFFGFGILIALLVGFLWIPFGNIFLSLKLPFSVSGLLTGVWFIPVYLGAVIQNRFDQTAPGLILVMETVAGFISGWLGPLGWLSFHFGFAQGVFGEIAFLASKNIFSLALALVLADLILMLLHPSLTALRELPRLEWIKHFAGVLVSALLVASLFHFSLPEVHDSVRDFNKCQKKSIDC